jgi:ribosomal protein L11 methyltransferase
MRKYISVVFDAPAEQRAILSALLLDAGFTGVEEKPDQMIASIEADLFDETAVKAMMSDFAIPYQLLESEEQNWNADWEKSFEPVAVEDFAIIRAGFHAPSSNFKHEIIITPKMSFGTGHHATTYLMIQQMKDIDFTGKSVIDFGTGTGVLAILAEKLGAASVLAIDNDEWSINNCRENIEDNHCQRINARLADTIPEEPVADIILANINLNVILDNLERIKAALANGGLVLFSGLLVSDEDIISKSLTAKGFSLQNVKNRNGWICLLTSQNSYPQS